MFVQAVMVPLLAADLRDFGLRTPVIVIVLLGVVTAQVVLVCVWRLAR
ncbi:Transmembrane transporter OS=Streptomyces glaucescens OX=1907 GN=SGLAU_14790 PE=4 SV=1 [Streptomyces glaucescens]